MQIKRLLNILIFLNSDHQGSDERRWRNNGKCGLRYPLSDGSPTECDPHGHRPCCGISGICSNKTSTCDYPGSIDYREVWNWRQAGEIVTTLVLSIIGRSGARGKQVGLGRQNHVNSNVRAKSKYDHSFNRCGV